MSDEVSGILVDSHVTVCVQQAFSYINANINTDINCRVTAETNNEFIYCFHCIDEEMVDFFFEIQPLRL